MLNIQILCSVYLCTFTSPPVHVSLATNPFFQTLTLVGCVLMFVSTQGLLARFANQAGLWQKAVKAMSELDALMALGYAAQFGGDGAPMCRPTFLDPQAFDASQPAHVSMPVEE